jgi:L-lactate dehydrogenase (cytochrome)
MSIKETDSVIVDNKLYQLSTIPDSLRKELIDYLKSEPFTKPELDEIYNLNDFTPVAEKTLSKPAWSYYRTGAADEITLRENVNAWQRIYFRPRILKDVTEVSLKTKLLGSESSYPFYITAFAGCALDNNVDAERPLVRASDRAGGIYMLPFQTSLGITDLSNEGQHDQWLQIYVGTDREITLNAIKEAESVGRIKALCFTVDMAQLGRRETYQRTSGSSSFTKTHEAIASSLNWEEVRNYKDTTSLKCVLKGIQTKEDAVKAVEYGFHGIILSNHGGRQLDTARSGVEVLSEVTQELKAKGLQDKIEVFVDGGVNRGSDIVKALALGAKAVGLGRPMLYALQTYGEAGVERAIEILRDEVELNLRLLGIRSIEALSSDYVDASHLSEKRTTNAI